MRRRQCWKSRKGKGWSADREQQIDWHGDEEIEQECLGHSQGLSFRSQHQVDSEGCEDGDREQTVGNACEDYQPEMSSYKPAEVETRRTEEAVDLVNKKDPA